MIREDEDTSRKGERENDRREIRAWISTARTPEAIMEMRSDTTRRAVIVAGFVVRRSC